MEDVVRQSQRPFVVPGSGLPPLETLEVVGDREIPRGRRKSRLGILNLVLAPREPGLQLQFAAGFKRHFAQERQAGVAPVIVDAGIAAIPDTGHGKGVVHRPHPSAVAQEPVGDALAAARDPGGKTGILGGAAGLDVDHRLQGVGTVRGGGGTPHDLDPLDVFQRNGQVVPLDHPARVLKNPLSVQQQQGPPRVLVGQTVVGGGRQAIVLVTDLETGHQAGGRRPAGERPRLRSSPGR